MSFNTGQITGSAQDIVATFQFKQDHEREQRVLAVVQEVVQKIAQEVGGYLAVSVQGHINSFEGGPGDGINLQVNSILPPPPPAKDAGLDAFGGSARNFPPEASTAAPATEDNSPPATQEPIPQSADAVPPLELAPQPFEVSDESSEEVSDLPQAA